jgi:hypothetical protein
VGLIEDNRPHGKRVEMGVIRAQIQTVEEIYALVWTSVAKKQPFEASYQDC